jgi:hypothetical protein
MVITGRGEASLMIEYIDTDFFYRMLRPYESNL